MKKFWMAASLAALLALPLAGCGGDRTGGTVTTPDPSAVPSQTAPSPSPMLDPDAGSEDLAGADGIVGGDDNGGNGTGNAGNENAPGQADNSPLEDLGDGVRDTLDDLGEGARDTLDDLGSAARQAGRDAQRVIEGR